MKKVMILAVVAALLGISAPNTSAQVPGSTQPSSTEQEDERDQQSTQPSSPTTQPSSPSTQPGTSGTQSGAQQGTSGSQSSIEYKEEVKSVDLPAAITRSLNEKYPGYKTEKAFRGADGTYKVKVSKGDEHQTLFFDERGESVKMPADKDKMTK